MGELAEQKSAEIINVIERMASNPDIDVMKLEKMLDMQERIINKQAEQAWTQAMTQAQLEMPVINPDGFNEQTRSKYAKYETINKVIKPVYTSHGFSLTFSQGESAAGIRVVCVVSHKDGHSKEYHVDLEPDMVGIKGNQNKTAVHGAASTFSYGQRYLAKLIFNLTISGEDDDGNAAGGDTRSAKEVDQAHIDYMTVVRDLWPSINAIKEGIATGDLSRAIEAYSELDEDEKRAIWKAPTKGGVFTTQERTAMKSDEWAKMRSIMSDTLTTSEDYQEVFGEADND